MQSCAATNYLSIVPSYIDIKQWVFQEYSLMQHHPQPESLNAIKSPLQQKQPAMSV